MNITNEQPTYQDLEKERMKAKDQLHSVMDDLKKLKEVAVKEDNKSMIKALDYLINIKIP